MAILFLHSMPAYILICTYLVVTRTSIIAYCVIYPVYRVHIEWPIRLNTLLTIDWSNWMSILIRTLQLFEMNPQWAASSKNMPARFEKNVLKVWQIDNKIKVKNAFCTSFLIFQKTGPIWAKTKKSVSCQKKHTFFGNTKSQAFRDPFMWCFS